MYYPKFKIGELVYYMHGSSVCFTPVCRIRVEEEHGEVCISYKVYPPYDDCFLILLEESVHAKISDLFEHLQKTIIKIEE